MAALPRPCGIRNTRIRFLTISSLPQMMQPCSKVRKKAMDRNCCHDGIVKPRTRNRWTEKQKKLRAVGSNQQQPPSGIMHIEHPNCSGATKVYFDGLGYNVASGVRL